MESASVATTRRLAIAAPSSAPFPRCQELFEDDDGRRFVETPLSLGGRESGSPEPLLRLDAREPFPDGVDGKIHGGFELIEESPDAAGRVTFGPVGTDGKSDDDGLGFEFAGELGQTGDSRDVGHVPERRHAARSQSEGIRDGDADPPSPVINSKRSHWGFGEYSRRPPPLATRGFGDEPLQGVRTVVVRSRAVTDRTPSPTHASLWTRLLTGDGRRRSRLHTYGGKRLDVGGLLYLPHAVWSTVALKAFGSWTKAPWLSYRGVREIDRLLQPDWKVLEFGSGMSSRFFAARCAELVSIESDADWYERMRPSLAAAAGCRVDYRLRSEADYADLDDIPDGYFDFALVDGLQYDRTAATAVRKVRPGGSIYMDNSDIPYEEFRAGRQTLLDAAEPGSVRFFVDFSPFWLSVNEGMLVRLPLASGTSG